MSIIDYEAVIKGSLEELDLIDQLAEEAAELAHAALKLKRVLKGKNPSPVSVERAREKMLEEIADVRVSVDMILRDDERYEVANTEISKKARWAYRLLQDGKTRQ